MRVNSIKIIALYVIGILIVYITLYYIIMDRNNPAKDSEQKEMYCSSFKYGELATTRINGRTTTYIKCTIYNYIFYPIDKIINYKWYSTNEISINH